MVCGVTKSKSTEAVGGKPGSHPCCATTPATFFLGDTPMSDVKYFQLEPSAFLTDIDFQMMDAECRGGYCSIILYLYCNHGSIELSDGKKVTLLESPTTILAQISGCRRTGQDWDALWAKIAHKFQTDGVLLTHKRVTEEIQKVEDYRKTKSEAGKKGMASRWGDNTPITKVSKVKLSKDKLIKKTYCEFVYLTEEEHTKLKEKFGPTLQAKIQALNDYIGSTGKMYKSHYFTILSWARRNGETDKPKEKTCMEIYLEGDDGKEYLKTQEGLDWLQTEDGRRYAASRSG